MIGKPCLSVVAFPSRRCAISENMFFDFLESCTTLSEYGSFWGLFFGFWALLGYCGILAPNMALFKITPISANIVFFVAEGLPVSMVYSFVKHHVFILS